MPADGLEIGRLQVESMRSGFTEIVPPELMPPMDAAAQGEKYAKYAQDTDCLTFIAENSRGHITGFTCAGPNRGEEKEMDAELYALYVHPKFFGEGIGPLLLEHLLTQVKHTSWRSLIVWFFAANALAEKCYLKTGARELNYSTPPQGYIPIPHKACGWFFD